MAPQVRNYLIDCILGSEMTSNLQLQVENISGLIHFIRGEKVILDVDLAKLYEIPTRVLKQAVRRNLNRFPIDFMFQLNEEESEMMRSQIVTANLRSQFVTSSL